MTDIVVIPWDCPDCSLPNFLEATVSIIKMHDGLHAAVRVDNVVECWSCKGK